MTDAAVVDAEEPKKKRKNKTSPTQRSLAHLRKLGFKVAITEHWNPHVKIRQDLFGFIDLLAIKDGETVAVQTTSGSCRADRRKKIMAHENLPVVLSANWNVIIHAWRKNSKGKWILTEESITEYVPLEEGVNENEQTREAPAASTAQ